MEEKTALFKKYMKDIQKVNVTGDIGWEGVSLHHEEIDENLIPPRILRDLPDPLLTYLTSYEDGETEWVFILAVEEGTYRVLRGFCVKDGELVDDEVLNR